VEKNYAEAVEWYRAAARQGNADAMFALGICSYYGNGVPQSTEIALYMYERAAARGHKKAKEFIAAAGARAASSEAAISRPSPQSESDALAGIKQRAIERWPKDYEMQEYEIRNQTEAYRSAKTKTSATGVPSEVFQEIKQKAIEKWPKDYEMQEYEIRNQTEAYRKLHQ